MEGRERLPSPSDSAAQTKVTRAAAKSMVSIPETEATGETGNAGVRNQSPLEGGANARDNEIASLRMENIRVRVRLEIQAEEREKTNRAQQKRLRLGGGGMGPQQSEQRVQPGTFVIGFGKPAPKLDDKLGSVFI